VKARLRIALPHADVSPHGVRALVARRLASARRAQRRKSGLEAAAASAVLMVTGAAYLPHKEPVSIPMIVNRPYLSRSSTSRRALLMLAPVEEPRE
jgi:hypothetical protein